MLDMIQIGIKGKLALIYVDQFEIFKKVGDVAYRLNLPPQLDHVHNVFHLSMFKKHTQNPSHVLPYTEIPLQADMTYEEQLAKILARELRM